MTHGPGETGETTESHIRARVEHFGRELYRLRTEAHMSQVDLMRALGLKSSAYIGRLERGQQAPTFDMLVRLKSIFGVSIASLVEPETPHHTNHTTIHTLFSASGGSVMFLGCEHLETLVAWLKSRASVSESP